MKPLLILLLSTMTLFTPAQVSFGINSGVGIGFNAPENFAPKTKYSFCFGRKQIKYAAFLFNNQVSFKRSENHGAAWADSIPVFAIPSASSTMVNNRRIETEPRIACDLSGGYFNNRIYIVWSDLKSGKKNLDVFLVYSEDEGQHWTEPLLLSYHPNHKHQFMPDVMVDPKNGAVYVLYGDQQNFIAENLCDIQLAISYNGGLKFSHFFLNQAPIKFSGAIAPQLILTEFGINAFWTKSSDGCLLSEASKLQSQRGQSRIHFEQKSYAYTKSLQITFELDADCHISAELSKPLDAGFQKIIFKKKKHKKGKNTLSLKPYFINLPEDTYILTLYDENGNHFAWITSN
jgi:hypothetical protein